MQASELALVGVVAAAVAGPDAADDGMGVKVSGIGTGGGGGGDGK